MSCRVPTRGRESRIAFTLSPPVMLSEASRVGSVEERPPAEGPRAARGHQAGGATTVPAVRMLSQLYIPSTHSFQSTLSLSVATGRVTGLTSPSATRTASGRC